MSDAQRYYQVTRASVALDSSLAIEVGLRLRRLVLSEKIASTHFERTPENSNVMDQRLAELYLRRCDLNNRIIEIRDSK